MTPNQLRAFHAVATHGSFTRAARHLSVTQPALTAQVKALEAAHGVLLFDRRPRGVELTAMGRSLLSVAEELVNVETRAEAILSGREGGLSGGVRIGADNPYRLMPLLVRLRATHPHVRIQAAFGNGREVTEMLESHRVDLALISGPIHDERIHFVPLAAEPLTIVTPLEHPWARRRSIALSALNEREMIRREPGSRTQAELDRACAEAGVRPRYVLEIAGREALREAVAVGLGIGVMSRGELGGGGQLHAVAIRALDVRLRESMACLSARKNAPVIDAFFRLVSSTVRA